MSSAAEEEIDAVLLTSTELVPIWTTLHELSYLQPATPIQLDNTICSEFSNDTILKKRTKLIDMRLYWIQDNTEQ